ncbi:MAG: hypothetical protein A2Y33_15195 [Spirochaetes bacterium GWF1_51_8]|nr:MAG: hypothetical protein A2Y33_15195 [Spirochaetes bacterium GWF1_51_8]
MKFELTREKRTPRYTARTKSKKAKSMLLVGAFLLAGVSVSGAVDEDCKPLLGEPVAMPKPLTSEQVKAIVNETFKNTLGFELKDEKVISLKSGKNTVKFFAENYNSQKKIAFEWMGDSGYYDGKNEFSKLLSKDEMKWIDKYQFDQTFIIVSYGINQESIRYDIANFIKFYTNR